MLLPALPLCSLLQTREHGKVSLPAFLESVGKTGNCPAQYLMLEPVSMLKVTHELSGQRRGSGMTSNCSAEAEASWEKTNSL